MFTVSQDLILYAAVIGGWVTPVYMTQKCVRDFDKRMAETKWNAVGEDMKWNKMELIWEVSDKRI